MKIYIVYDSESGHTEALAKSIAEGAKGVPQAEIYIDHVKNANPEDMAEMDAIIWGCPGHFGTISVGLKAWIDACQRTFRKMSFTGLITGSELPVLLKQILMFR